MFLEKYEVTALFTNRNAFLVNSAVLLNNMAVVLFFP